MFDSRFVVCNLSFGGESGIMIHMISRPDFCEQFNPHAVGAISLRWLMGLVFRLGGLPLGSVQV